MRVTGPLGLRDPPLILRAMTNGRTLRSARLLWAGTPGKSDEGKHLWQEALDAFT